MTSEAGGPLWKLIPARMCEKLVGLGEVDLVGINDPGEGAPLEVVIGSRKARPLCVACGGSVWSKGYRSVVLVDLPAFGRPVRLRWRKRRWTCPNTDCEIRSFIEQGPTIGPQRALLTSRAARWVTIQVGGRGRPIQEVAAELGCDWHTVNKEVGRWGEALLGADTDRIGEVGAVGIDKKRCSGGKAGGAPKSGAPLSSTLAATSRFDIVGGRTAESAAAWFRSQPTEWCEAIRWAVSDMSGPYRKAYNRVLPHALQVADPFHVIRLANQRLDDLRRRVQNETLGHRGRKDDPLYRIRRLLTAAHERISDRGQTRLRGLLDAGDPYGEVRTAWHATETVRGIYGIESPALALRYTLQLADDLQDESCPPEINKLGRTIARWTPQITNWHISKVTNRCHRSPQQPHQTDQTSSVRVPQLRELPNPRPSLRRETQLGPPRHRHSPLKSEEPETLGHRGRKDDPLYRIRRLLTAAHERISDRGQTRLRGLLDAGDPHGEVRTAWHAKETVRGIYGIESPALALRYTLQLADDLQDESCPPEINKLGRTIARWTPQITNWHISKVTNGPTEALNNLIKRIKRAAFGFRNFANYRIRALLYAGKPNWDLLPSVTPH